MKSVIRCVAGGLLCGFAAWLLTSGDAAVRVDAAGSCEGLSALTLPAATITAAKIEAESCRVAATLKPSSDSEIKMEVWMPVSNWNGKYQAVGNGAFNGNINMRRHDDGARPRVCRQLDRHRAHWRQRELRPRASREGDRLRMARGARDRRGVQGHHRGVLRRCAEFSYFNGCSAGGRQAMQEAQRFPADFNGIIAGAPGLDWTGRAASAVRIAQRLEQNEAARLGQAQRQLLHAAVVESCDLLDGVKDGVLENPKRCTFDPGVLECKGSEEGPRVSPPRKWKRRE